MEHNGNKHRPKNRKKRAHFYPPFFNSAIFFTACLTARESIRPEVADEEKLPSPIATILPAARGRAFLSKAADSAAFQIRTSTARLRLVRQRELYSRSLP
jgi:hypothetical protein